MYESARFSYPCQHRALLLSKVFVNFYHTPVAARTYSVTVSFPVPLCLRKSLRITEVPPRSIFSRVSQLDEWPQHPPNPTSQKPWHLSPHHPSHPSLSVYHNFLPNLDILNISQTYPILCSPVATTLVQASMSSHLYRSKSFLTSLLAHSLAPQSICHEGGGEVFRIQV